MKQFLQLLFLLFISITYAQTEFTQSKEVDSDKKLNYTSQTDVTESGNIINLSVGRKQSHLSGKRDYILSYYDKELKLIKEINFSKKIKGDVIALKVIDNIVNIIVTNSPGAFTKNHSVKKVVRFYCSLDDFQLKEQTIFNNKKAKGSAKFIFSNTNDYNSLVVGFKNSNVVLVYNKNFEKQYEKEIKISSSNPHQISDACYIDNSILLLRKVFKSAKKKACTYQLINVNENSSDIIKLDTKNKSVNDLKIFNKNKEVYLVGHYSNYAEPQELLGFYFSKLNTINSKQELTKLSAFSNEYKEKMNLLGKKGFTESDYLEIFDFYVYENSYFLINESQYSISIHESETNSNFGIYTMYLGNISISKFNKEFNLINYDIIYKSQTINPFYPKDRISFCINKQGNIYIYLYAVEEAYDDFRFYTRRDAPYSSVEFVYTENLDKKVNKRDDIHYNSINSFNYNNDYFILFSKGRNKRGIVKIVPK